jgi:hypothetical protein
LNPDGYDLVVLLIADRTPDDDRGHGVGDDAPVEEWAEPSRAVWTVLTR